MLFDGRRIYKRRHAYGYPSINFTNSQYIFDCKSREMMLRCVPMPITSSTSPQLLETIPEESIGEQTH
jgi:hypothetical protein